MMPCTLIGYWYLRYVSALFVSRFVSNFGRGPFASDGHGHHFAGLDVRCIEFLTKRWWSKEAIPKKHLWLMWHHLSHHLLQGRWRRIFRIFFLKMALFQGLGWWDMIVHPDLSEFGWRKPHMHLDNPSPVASLQVPSFSVRIPYIFLHLSTLPSFMVLCECLKLFWGETSQQKNFTVTSLPSPNNKKGWVWERSKNMLESPLYMDVSKNRGGPPKSSHLFIGFGTMIFNHPFWGVEKKTLFLVQHPYHSISITGSLLVSKKLRIWNRWSSPIFPKVASPYVVSTSRWGSPGWGRRATMLVWGVGETMLVDGLMVPKKGSNFLGTHVI